MPHTSSVLFVCTANRCRSPMAEAIFKAHLEKMLGKAALKSWRIESAGTWTPAGLPPASGAVAALAGMGINLPDHRSRPVTEELLEQFNLVLGMEQGHKEAIQVEFPHLAGRVYLFSEMVYSNFDVQDPLGGKPSDYEATAELIEGVIQDGLERFINLATS